MSQKKTLLAVFAHPDDETFATGGTLALYAQRGVDVYLLCATRGEAGEVEQKYLESFASIAELRQAELACAAKKLGLSGVFFLSYRDSGMTGSPHHTHPAALINAPLEDLAGEIAGWIRRLRPQVVITSDPIGGYYHPDHIHLQRAVQQAFFIAGDANAYTDSLPAYTPQKLYFNTIPRTLLRWVVRLMPIFGKDPRRFGQNGDIDIPAITAVDFPVHARIDFSEVARLRKEASNCYASQGGQHLHQGIAALLRGWTLSGEIFMRGYPPPRPGYVEKDLFESISLEH